MSEPYSVMLRLRMCQQDLARWLAAPVPAASRWSDWRGIAGQWRMHNGGCLASSSEADLQEPLADCQTLLARYPDNRAALDAILATAQADTIRIAAYERTGTQFVA
ncbi:hypothetical protein, partial [Escherichia coli]|uniref:hypothetical protein n=1 Tax=Escherichia coli TaxID=562 RepID=UPI00227E8512